MDVIMLAGVSVVMGFVLIGCIVLAGGSKDD